MSEPAFTHTGDIKLGSCTFSEVEDILGFIKSTCQNGYPIYLKKTELDEYYVSVPITLNSMSKENPYIYTIPELLPCPFYFVDLYFPPSMVCITYDTVTHEFVSNIEYEGCTQKELACEPSLYEILPFSDCNWENDEQYTHVHMHLAKQLFVCSG
jgi:hypothetical protein